MLPGRWGFLEVLPGSCSANKLSCTPGHLNNHRSHTILGSSRRALGAIVPVGDGESVDESLFVHVGAEGPLERVDLVRSGAVVDSLATEGRLEVTLQRDVEGLRAGEYVYVRAVQEDGLAAWSSPVFFE